MFKKASVIIASRNEGSMLRQTIDFIRRSPARLPYEIIAVDDGSDDESFSWLASDSGDIRYTKTPGLGIVPARNCGAKLAGGDMLVFCDAHIDVEPYWLDELARVLTELGADGVSPAFRDLDHDNPLYNPFKMLETARSSQENPIKCGRSFRRLTETFWMHIQDAPFETPILSGACWAVRSEVFWAVGGYEGAFRGYGGEEEEISLQLWLNGYKLYATPYTCVFHQFRMMPSYRIDPAAFFRNRMITALCHYNKARVRRLLAEHANSVPIQIAYAEVFTPENIERLRLPRFARRKYDDDWYFKRFGLEL